MGLTSTKAIYYEIEHNLEVILLLVFMVAGIYFMKNLMKNNKLIIGMVHFPPLPGTPEFDDNFFNDFKDGKKPPGKIYF